MKEGRSIQIKNNINFFLNSYFKVVIYSISFLIIVSGYFFLIQPKYKSIVNEINLTGKQKEFEYSERLKYLNQLTELKAEYQKISPININKVKAMLPDEKNHERLLAQLEGIVLKNGLLLTSLQVGDAGPLSEVISISEKDADIEENKSSDEEITNGINVVKIKMNIVGTDYVGFKNILNAIENNLRLMDIDSLSFNPGGNSTSLELSTYYLENLKDLDNKE